MAAEARPLIGTAFLSHQNVVVLPQERAIHATFDEFKVVVGGDVG
jgi:hypothetical protein